MAIVDGTVLSVNVGGVREFESSPDGRSGSWMLLGVLALAAAQCCAELGSRSIGGWLTERRP